MSSLHSSESSPQPPILEAVDLSHIPEGEARDYAQNLIAQIRALSPGFDFSSPEMIREQIDHLAQEAMVGTFPQESMEKIVKLLEVLNEMWKTKELPEEEKYKRERYRAELQEEKQRIIGGWFADIHSQLVVQTRRSNGEQDDTQYLIEPILASMTFPCEPQLLLRLKPNFLEYAQNILNKPSDFSDEMGEIYDRARQPMIFSIFSKILAEIPVDERSHFVIHFEPRSADPLQYVGERWLYGFLEVDEGGSYLGAQMTGGKITAQNAGIYAGQVMGGGELVVADLVGDSLGAQMTGGKITVSTAGLNAGFSMTGGEIVIVKTAGEKLGRQMQGGILRTGSAGPRVGEEMQGGEIIIEQDAGAYLGRKMKRGKITVENVGDYLGIEMSGGEIVVNGSVGNSIGYESTGGKIFINDPLMTKEILLPKIGRPCKAEIILHGKRIWPFENRKTPYVHPVGGSRKRKKKK